MIKHEKIKEVVNIIVKHFAPEKIILFGSYAYGNPSDNSDLDLLIIKETNIPRHKRALEFRKYLRGLKIPLELLVYNKKEIEKWQGVNTAFITEIVKQGKVLYEHKR